MIKKPAQSLVGCRVELVRCKDPHSLLKQGDEGTVVAVDDAGTAHIDWDNGTKFGLVWDAGDRWKVLRAVNK